MGWSELAFAPEIDAVFKEAELKYKMRRVLQPGTNPVIQIMHEKELDVPQMRTIIDLFPDFVYVEFVPNSVFQETNPGTNYSWGE